MKKWAKIAGILLVLGVLGYVVYNQVLKWHETTMDASLEQRRATWQEESERLEREIADLKEKLELEKEATLPEDRLKAVFGEDVDVVEGGQDESPQEEADRKVREFFAYLDGQEYVQAHDLDRGTFETFRAMVDRLEAHPPAVSAELKDPFLLIRNIAHFYRVLGKRNLRLAREVLVEEAEIAEPIGAVLYEWLLPEDPAGEATEGRPSLKALYEYAGFFLNSVGGRSYLLRRDPRVRVLTAYYCVRILDLANEEEINRHGIDIRPHIESVSEEVRSQRGLVDQKEYLDTLASLREKYARG